MSAARHRATDRLKLAHDLLRQAARDIAEWSSESEWMAQPDYSSSRHNPPDDLKGRTDLAEKVDEAATQAFMWHWLIDPERKEVGPNEAFSPRAA